MWGFPSGSAVKNLPVMQKLQETWVGSLVGKILWRRKWQNSSILAWIIPATEEPAGYTHKNNIFKAEIRKKLKAYQEVD